MVNKAGGAGVQVTAYTQTHERHRGQDRLRAKAGQIIGNFNNLFMLRVRETATAELLTNQLPKVQIYTSTPASGANDAISNKKAAFTSSSHDQVQMTSVPMLEPAHIVGLPKGQAFALLEGGNLWKIRNTAAGGRSRRGDAEKPAGAGCRYAQGPGRQQRVVGGAGILRPAGWSAPGPGRRFPSPRRR